jgi:acyl carrier protein phosphodiesterase
VHFLEDVELGGPESVKAIAEHMAECHMLVDKASELYRQQERRFNCIFLTLHFDLTCFRHDSQVILGAYQFLQRVARKKTRRTGKANRALGQGYRQAQEHWRYGCWPARDS